MQKRKMKTVLVSGALLSAILAGAAENLVKNGNLETVGEDGKFSDWKSSPTVTVQNDGVNKFARIKNDVPGTYVSMSQNIPVSSDWERLAVHFKMRVNSLDEKTAKKPGDVPRAMFVFTTASGEKHYRPLCLLADKTDGKFVELWEDVEIPPDSKNVGVVLDLSGSAGEVDVDDIEVFADYGKLLPLSVLKDAGKFNHRRKLTASTPPCWLVRYDISSQEKPQIRIESEEDQKFLRVENKDINKDITCENYFGLDPSWKKIKISAKIRAKDLKCGPENYQDARVMAIFTDAKGNKVGGYGAVPSTRADQDWKEMSAVREVPEGAAAVRLQPGLFHSTGTADFDEINVGKGD